MPQPKSTLELLIRKDQLTDDDWLYLLESRRREIKPHLKMFTLPEIGSLTRFGKSCPISKDEPEIIGSGKFSLKTQIVSEILYKSICPGSIPPSGSFHINVPQKIWALTRKGLWVVITFTFCDEEYLPCHKRVKTVEIREVPLVDLLDETQCQPMDIFDAIAKASRSWVRSSEERLRVSSAVAAHLFLENRMIRQIMDEKS